MIRVEDLRKVYTSAPPAAAPVRGPMMPRFGRREPRTKTEVVALDGISLEVGAGEIFGLLGPNGAGKSTTVGILTTRVLPTSGRASIGTLDIRRETVAVKRLIGVVPQRPYLDFGLTAREILTFHAAYFGMARPERERRASDLLDRFKLADRADQMTVGFSGGMAQRLSIARALMHDPQVLFLDEPSAGLDPQTRLLLWDLIRDDNRRKRTVLLTTHYMEEADALCDRIAIIDHGRIIAIGTPAELKATIPGGYLVRVLFDRVAADLRSSLATLPGVTEAQARGDDGIDLYADRGGPLVPLIANAASAAGVTIRDVHIETPSLETLFLHHTGRSLRE